MSPVLAEASNATGSEIWLRILEVVLFGSVAGVGLSVAFAFALRGVVAANQARRTGDMGGWVRNAALGLVAGLVCVGAIVFAFVEILAG
ncbi:hypothetical protein [Patulibacter sp. SYSU D01012]|uniref:hypothetical protein n=1 Tax=Patulibacter sp. SYSU D01012 TaxID=2817381 RepID=UPI001B305D3A|nr:hypothetical protein [Patulibacter sp. SYSU D01012]